MTEEQHRDVIAGRLAEEEVRVAESNSEAYRSQLLRDLGLGLPLHGVAPAPADPGLRSPLPSSRLSPRHPIGDSRSRDTLAPISDAGPKLFTLDRVS